MQAILIADNQDEKEVLIFLLRRAGLAVAASSDVQRVLKNWTDHPSDLMILVVPDDKDPQKILDEIRSITQVPLLMILEHPSERVLCELLTHGADIVLTRPLSHQLLNAHIQALTRRSASIPSFVLPSLELDEITLDPSTRTVSVANQGSRRLTQLEFRLLYTLMTNRGQVIPTEVLVERVWGYTGEGNRDLVRGLISRLRQKIEPDPESPHFLETITGVGYRFIVDHV